MPDELWKIVDRCRGAGLSITNDEVNDVYRHCLRKMKISKGKRPEEYLFWLFSDEIKDYLIRRAITAMTMIRTIKKEEVQYGRAAKK